MRSFMRDSNLGKAHRRQHPGGRGLTEEEMYLLYRLLSPGTTISYVIPEATGDCA